MVRAFQDFCQTSGVLGEYWKTRGHQVDIKKPQEYLTLKSFIIDRNMKLNPTRPTSANKEPCDDVNQFDSTFYIPFSII